MPEVLSVTAPHANSFLFDEALAAMGQELRKIRFGSIAVTIHDGKVVQLDVTEKRRIAR